MAYRTEKNSAGQQDLVIDGFEKGIAPSPYLGIGNIRNLNTSYYPGVAYVNYRRQACTFTETGETLWLAGSHSTNVSGNSGWTFLSSAVAIMTNPVQKATSPAGLNYVLDDSGQVWKQSSVNSTTFNLLAGGDGRITNGAGGIAYWNNYIVVFGNGLIEFCGDGTGDSGIIFTNWNKQNYGIAYNSDTFTTNFAAHATRLVLGNSTIPPNFTVGDPIQFTTTGTLPTGISTGTTYYIVTIDTTNIYIEVSATVGGSAINLTGDGTGTHTVTDQANILPVGNSTAFQFTFTPPVATASQITITSYVNPIGATITSNWLGATGQYAIIDPNGAKWLGNFTYGSNIVSFSSLLISVPVGTYTIRLLDTSVTFYRPYVSKVDGNLYFCNGQFLGQILAENTNTLFNPASYLTYTVQYGVTSITQPQDTITDMVDLKDILIVSGKFDTYTWDYISSNMSAPAPVGEQIVNIINDLNNIYIFAGQKGNIYLSNGYSSQLLQKMPDFLTGVIDPVWLWGGVMVKRSRLFFQAFAKNTSGANIFAGIFSIIVSPSVLGEAATGLVMEAQNSYGLTPASGALQNGVLMNDDSSSSGQTAYYSAWSNGATTGGIDYNDTSPWQNYEPTIETDIVPIGDILNKATLGQTQFKLDRPMTSGDSIKLYWRPTLTDSYTLIGTTTTTQISEYFPSNISMSQWAQFKITFKCASSGSSFIPIREMRVQSK